MANQNGWNTVGTEEEVNTQAPTQQEDKLDFLSTPVGETKIRIMDEAPYFYQGFWAVKGNGGNNNGCFIPYKGKGKDLLEKANYEYMDKVFKVADEKGLAKGSEARKKHTKAGYDKQPYGKLKSKYIIHVIDRADGQLKLLDAGAGIFEELKKYAINPEYGDLREYDVTITREGTGWMDTKYSVTPARSNTPRTPEEIANYEAKKVSLAELKGGENLTPEQCLFIAQGGLWSEVGSVGQATEESTQNKDYTGDACSSCDEPQWNSPSGVTCDNGHGGAEPKEKSQVDTSKEGALSDEELADIDF